MHGILLMADSLYVPDLDAEEKARAEGPNDVRHLGRYLIYLYTCLNCGPCHVAYDPDYPYCGPNSIWTCCHCAAVMRLQDPSPVIGTSRLNQSTVVRGST